MSRKKIILITGILVGIVAGVLFLLNNYSMPKIINFSPQNGSVNIDPKTNVSLVFDRQLTNDEKNKVVVKINPSEDLDTSWVEKQLNIGAKKGFSVKTNYSIEVLYNGNKLLSFSFQTVPYTQQQILKDTQNQLPLERQFDQDYTRTLNTNPWIARLPIETSQYRIVYDYAKNSFRIRILVPVTSDQQTQLVNQALSDLKSIGVTQTPIPYYVLTQ